MPTYDHPGAGAAQVTEAATEGHTSTWFYSRLAHRYALLLALGSRRRVPVLATV